MKWKNFIQRIFTEPDGNPSNKRVIATYAVIVYSIILLLAFLYSFPLNDAVIHMADVFLGSAMGTYVVGRFAEKGQYVQPVEEPAPVKKEKVEPEPVVEPEEDETTSNPEDVKK
jgi:hypothetical protein